MRDYLVRTDWALELIGSYKGNLEVCWALLHEDWVKLLSVRKLVERSQESVLFVYPESSELLMLKTGNVKSQGAFVPVSYDDAIKRDTWTMDPVTAKWYICK